VGSPSPRARSRTNWGQSTNFDFSGVSSPKMGRASRIVILGLIQHVTQGGSPAQIGYSIPISISTLIRSLSPILGDHLGSTRLVSNPDNSVRGRHDYLPFWEEIPSTIGSLSSVSGYGIIDFKQKYSKKNGIYRLWLLRSKAILPCCAFSRKRVVS